jgi:hypothetical protein
MFEQVVGKLQPILAKASSSISQATLVSRDQREKARASAVAAVQQEPEIKGLDKEMRVTCNASYYEDNSDSCELWVPGSPLFPLGLLCELNTAGSHADKAKFCNALGGI